jgi:hypothetical protein
MLFSVTDGYKHARLFPFTSLAVIIMFLVYMCGCYKVSIPPLYFIIDKRFEVFTIMEAHIVVL